MLPRTLLLAAALASGPALAHETFGGGKPLLSGAAHLLVSPLSLAAMLGLVASTADARDPWPLIIGAIAGTACVLGVMLSPIAPAWAGPAGTIIAGLVAVAGLNPVSSGTAALALVAGLAAGASAQLDAPNLTAALGAGGVVLLVTAAGVAAFDGLLPATQLRFSVAIARRIAGAWVVALGALLAALALKMHGAWN
ncbi:MAG: hypothetical protein LH632_11375 [Rhodoferax sp.]|nr:hypothetical protein [Rhodoferax sp.]